MERRITILFTSLVLMLGLAACEEQLGFRNPGGHQTTLENPDGAGSGKYFPYALGKVVEVCGNHRLQLGLP